MRNLLLLPAVLITLFACNVSSDQDYKEMAKDTCNCVNLLSKDLSSGMLQMLVASEGDEAKIQQGMMDLMLSEPETTLKDIEILQGRGTEEMEACMSKVEKKYDDVYTMLSEDQVADRIMKELKTMKGCENSAAIIKMGLEAEK